MKVRIMKELKIRINGVTATTTEHDRRRKLENCVHCRKPTTSRSVSKSLYGSLEQVAAHPDCTIDAAILKALKA